MATEFTESQKLDIGIILGVDQVTLDDKIRYNSAQITPEVIAKVADLIVTWNAGAGSKTTKIHPKESNKGVETNPGAAQQQIRRDVATLLFCSELIQGSGFTVRAMRG